MNWTKPFVVGAETKRHESKLFAANLQKLFVTGFCCGVLFASTWFLVSSGAFERRYIGTYAWSYFFSKHPGKDSSEKKRFALYPNTSNYRLPLASVPRSKQTAYQNVADLKWDDGKPVIEWRGRFKDSEVYTYLKKSIFKEDFPVLFYRFLFYFIIFAGGCMLATALS
ncbi:hypothetical protein L0222_19735 [bacterium]|nr:hypothetical protein [bacterium]